MVRLIHSGWPVVTAGVDRANSVVFNQLFVCHPAEALYYVGDAVIALSPAHYSCTKVDKFVNAMDLGIRARPIHRQAVVNR